MHVDVDIRSRYEPFTQTITIETSAGTDQLFLDIKTAELTQREKDQRAAFADRQAVFKNNCAACHLQPALGKPVTEQFHVLCGTCHNSAQRGEMVPDLQVVQKRRDRAYWEEWVRKGKPGTFMPAFAKRFGGPLTDEQIASLISYLESRFRGTHTLKP